MGDTTEVSPLIVTTHDTTPVSTPGGGGAPSTTRHRSQRYRTFQRLFKRYETPGTNREAIGDVLKDFDGDESRNALVLYLSVLAVVLHVAIGILAMSWLEGWSIYDAAYFCIVTTTTVGYGDITPTRGSSKLFVIYYVVVSIAIISAVLGHIVGMLIDRQEELLINAMEGGDEDSDSDNEIQARKGLVDESDIRQLVVSISTLLVILAMGVVVFMRLEKLSLLNALYVTVISASTVGFGDLQPTRNVSKMIMTIWLCFSTICAAKVVADVAAMVAKMKQKAVQRRLMSARMDIRTLVGMDKDRDNRVDKTEFLAQMLIRSGKVEEDEVQELLKRFDELDVDNSGYISPEECA
ncbi:Two pore potassium channel c [Gracilariopsis chorda]|uniref:Two pore potassium channel c n=1 Tax=Gracilariopsis chorda TaxID=448386 RepID=A0A2V3ITP7_9FLOR|nr:Two pore potassium channel c [Gracilariopsis chorda]|eukprot:PXF45484.1 Two pore potassium channel c [Gracilariopsis chorda]